MEAEKIVNDLRTYAKDFIIEESDNFYMEEFINHELEDDSISSGEAGFMQGYLNC